MCSFVVPIHYNFSLPLITRDSQRTGYSGDNSGAVPCLDDAVTTLAQRENSVAMQKAADHYSEQMAQRLRLPTDTLQELLDVHAACEKEAMAVFMENSFKDKNQQFLKKLVVIC